MSKRLVHLNIIFLSVFSIVILSLSSSVSAQKNGTKGGKGGDSNPAIVAYEVTAFSLPDPQGHAGPANSYGGVINNRIQIAGTYTKSDGDASAFFYDPQIDLETSFDLNLLAQGIPTGYVITATTSINEKGCIAVMCVSNPDLSFSDAANDVLRGVIDTESNFQFHLLPSPPVIYDETNEYAWSANINNANDVLIVSQQIEDGILERTSYVAIFDATSKTWSIDVFAPLRGVVGSGISDQLEDGSLLVVGTAIDASSRSSYPVRINLTNPNVSHVELVDYSESGIDYTFGHVYLSVNSFGEFLGLQTTTETTMKGKRTTTTTQTTIFKYTNQLQQDSSSLEHPGQLNNQLDYFAKLISTGRAVLNVDGRDSYLDIVDSIDFTTAPTINWESAETTMELRTLTDRIDVGADFDPSNDLPIIFGYAEVERGLYTAISSKPIILIPVIQN